MPKATAKKPAEDKPRAAKHERAEQRRAAEQAESTAKARRSRLISIAVLAVIAAVVVFVIVYVVPNYFPSAVTVPFSTFKSNFDSAQRVAVAVTYQNASQYIGETNCATEIVETIAHVRQPATIDFFEISPTNCTYTIGLGSSTSIATEPRSQCIDAAGGEPSITLSYNATNSTTIDASHMYVKGNAAYMQSCPIAVDLS